VTLSENPIGDEGAAIIAKCDIMSAASTLYLSNCNIGPKGITLLCDSLIRDGTIYNIDLSRNEFDLDSARALGNGLLQNGSLVYLDVSNVKLNAEMIGFICYGLKGNGSCKRMTLDKNKLDGQALSYLSDMLLNSNVTERLVAMNSCMIANNDFANFLPCISGNPECVKEIVLRDNRLGPNSMTQFFQALKNNTNIKRLDCTQNMIGKKGAEAAIDCLYHNQMIASFYTYSSDIPSNLEKTITELVSNNAKGIKNVIPKGYTPPSTEPIPLPMVLPPISPPTLSTSSVVSSDVSNILLRLKELEEKEKNREEEINNLKKQVGELKEKETSREKEIINLKKQVNEIEEKVESQGKEILKLKDETQENKMVASQPSFGFGGPTRNYMEYIQ